MLSHELLNLFHLKTCHVTLAWISSLGNPSTIQCINPVNLLGLNSHYVLCLEQCLSYNRYLKTFVGWVKESIGLTFCLPDHLSQNVPLFLIILIMESWSEGNVKTSILKSMRCETASRIYSKAVFWPYSRKVWPLLLQGRVFSSSELGQGIIEFYNIKCKGCKDCPFCPPPPWGSGSEGNEFGSGQPGKHWES